MGQRADGRSVAAAVAMLLGVWLTLGCTSSPAVPSSRASSPAAPTAPSGATPAGGQASIAPSARPAPLRARIAYGTIAGIMSPVWAAQEAGYFREHGLAVELSHIDAGAALLAALHNDEVDLALVGGSVLVVGYLQGLETKLVGALSNSPDVVVFTRPEIQTPEDLRGKIIGVTRLKSITDVAARMAFQQVGLRPDVDVFTRGSGGIAESLAAMDAGTLDGASISVPAVFEARKRGFRELLNVADMHIPLVGAAAGATARVRDAQPNVVEPALRAVMQGMARLRTDRELGIRVIGEYTRSDDTELLGDTIDYYLPRFQPDLYPDPRAVQAALDLEESPTARTTSPAEVVDTRFVERLRAGSAAAPR
jgi:NitT/TauT family transport system substrate-binding protein